MVKETTIILGVTGSIAAHKAVDVCSQLVKAGASLHVVMTRDAQEFITPLAFKTLSRNPVVTSLYDEEEGGSAEGEGWRPRHPRLADEADLILVAPATANTLAKLAQGQADDALGCIALAANPTAKLLLAPALNGKMWEHPATQANVALLKDRGAQFIGPAAGDLACGYEGLGRLARVEEIVESALQATGLAS